MTASRGFVLLHLSLSRLVVSDLARRLPTWAPIEFYAAIEGMDSVENCMDFIADRDAALIGWRLFSSCEDDAAGGLVQKVNGFEPLMIKGEAIAYARTADTETFCLADDFWNFAGFREVHQELIDLLGGGK